jgi:hypothetical protein
MQFVGQRLILGVFSAKLLRNRAKTGFENRRRKDSCSTISNQHAGGQMLTKENINNKYPRTDF